MGTMYAHTLDQYEAARLRNWFPCLTTTASSLDRSLMSRLESAQYDVDLCYADLICALRWYDNVPEGLLSMDDQELVERLSSSLMGVLHK